MLGLYSERLEIKAKICYNKLSLMCNCHLTVEGAWNVVKNNVEIDIKVMCIEAGTTQAKLAQQNKTDQV